MPLSFRQQSRRALGFRPTLVGKAEHIYVPEGREITLVTQQPSTHFLDWVVCHFLYLILQKLLFLLRELLVQD